MVKVLFSSHMRKVRAEQYFDKLLDSMYLYWKDVSLFVEILMHKLLHLWIMLKVLTWFPNTSILDYQQNYHGESLLNLLLGSNMCIMK